MRTSSKGIQMLAEGGVLIALALVLGMLKPYEFPNGGSISLEMLPLFVFCVRWGVGPGLVACAAFGVLQVFVQGAVGYGWVSIILDYIVAPIPVALAGLGRGKPGGIYWGSVLGAAGRFMVHFISGITVYRILAPTELMGMVFDNPYFYSFVYNISYIGVDLVLCLVIFALTYRTLKRYYLAEDLR